MSSNIAVWGDSMTPPVVANLQFLMPDRVVFDGSQIAQTSTVVAQRMIADGAHRDWILVIWCGHNNDTDPAQIKADIASMIGDLVPGNDRFIVLSLLNQAIPSEIKGGSNYGTIIQLDAELAALYPNNYIDVRTALIHHDDPSSAQDMQDLANDVVPTSLRYDEIHLRQEGSSFVAGILRDFIRGKGW
jgi:hypothetical protein